MSAQESREPEDRQRKSWTHNAAAWIRAVRNGQIESRRQGTNAAMVAAVEQYDVHRILDVGCGEGWLVHTLVEKGYGAVGVDGSAPLIASAREGSGHFLHLSYEEIAADPHCLDRSFDAAVCNFSLLDKEVTPLLEALRHRIRPGGYLLIQTVHPFTAQSDGPYRDGWRTETFDGFGEGFSESTPWYYRTFGSWTEVIGRSGYMLERCIEPRPEDTDMPLSLLLVCSVASV